jgi:hypothetical protein
MTTSKRSRSDDLTPVFSTDMGAYEAPIDEQREGIDPGVIQAIAKELKGIDLGLIQATADRAVTNPSDANARIQNGYVALSKAFGLLLHGDAIPENATFATFAAWAAVSLRREVVHDDDKRADRFHPARRLYRLVARKALDVDETIARNIVRGQAAIYEEIGSAIYKMLRLLRDARPELDADPETRTRQWQKLWDAYSSSLKEMPTHLNDRRHESEALAPADVSVLQRAMKPYFQVLAEGLSLAGIDRAAHKRRAELILLANIRVLAYEQKRVQPVDQRNFAYVPDALREMVASRLLGRSTALVHALRKPSERLRTVTAILGEAFQIAATRTVYSMVVGTEDVGFGRDLPMPPPANPLLRDRQSPLDQARYGAGAFFPYDLPNLDHSPTRAAWQQYDRSSGQGARTAVNNWLRYDERLNFLANLFRSRQQLTALYETPLSLPSTAPGPPARLGAALGPVSGATRDRLETSFGASS